MFSTIRIEIKLNFFHWQQNGFWLYYRRLEKCRFQWPKYSNQDPLVVEICELGWLLNGLSSEYKKMSTEVRRELKIVPVQVSIGTY